MKPIFNSQGKTVGWFIEYNKVVVDTLGRCRAFFSDDSAFSYEGSYLGEFGDGYFWDRSGNAVAFVEGASGGPALPVTETPPMPPIASTPPAQAVVSESPESAERSGTWSPLDFEEFLSA